MGRPVDDDGPVDDGSGPPDRGDTLPGMTIEVPPGQLYDLADELTATSSTVAAVPARLGDGAVGGDVEPALVSFCAAAAAAATLVAGELDWLGTTIAAVADAWLGLDGSLLAPPGGVVAR